MRSFSLNKTRSISPKFKRFLLFNRAGDEFCRTKLNHNKQELLRLLYLMIYFNSQQQPSSHPLKKIKKKKVEVVKTHQQCQSCHPP